MGPDASFEAGQRAIAATVALALDCPAGGDARWDAHLAQLGVAPLAPAERLRHLHEGPGQSRGALLLELRRALVAVAAPYEQAMEDGFRLEHAVEHAVRGYVRATRPVVSTSSIFAHAMASIPSSPGRSHHAARTATDTCSCCGAPVHERTLRACPYCGEAR
jgi:hypothetical protein